MKTILTIFIMISFISSVFAAPAWVPPDKREKFDRVMDSAREYAKILKSEPAIVEAKVEKKIKDKQGKVQKGIFLVAKVKRATLETDVIIEIDQNDKIKNILFKDGKVEIQYESGASSLKDKLTYGGIGAASGSIITVLLFLLL